MTIRGIRIRGGQLMEVRTQPARVAAVVIAVASQEDELLTPFDEQVCKA
jgi:hypothetical protein